MAMWMSCHNAVWHYKVFLHWAKGNGFIDSKEDDDNDDEVEPKRKWQQKEDKVDMRGCHGYKVVKTPGYGNVTADDLINKFHAMDKHFLWYLKEFLLAYSFPIPPLHNVLFGIIKCLSVTLPQIPQAADLTNLSDTIRTILPEPLQGQRKAVSTQFDTILAFEKAGLTAFPDPSNPLKGVHLLFTF